VEVPRIENSRFHRVWEIDSELSPSSWQTLSSSAFFVSDVFLENRKANVSIILSRYAMTLEYNNATVLGVFGMCPSSTHAPRGIDIPQSKFLSCSNEWGSPAHLKGKSEISFVFVSKMYTRSHR
jgi:hypothetical protein